MNLTLQLPLIDIERRLNDSLAEVLYRGEVADYEDLTVVVKKRSPIRILAENNILKIKAPIRAELFVGPKALLSWFKGLVKSIEEFDVDVSAHFEIQPDVSPNWQLSPKVKGTYKWDNEPKFNLGLVPIPLKPILDMVLDTQIRNTTKTIEKFLKDELNIRQYVQLGWDLMHKTLTIVDSLPLCVYFQPHAQPIYATSLLCEPKQIQACVSVPLYPEATVGLLPLPDEQTPPLPTFETVKSLPPDDDIQLSAKVDFAFVSRMLKDREVHLDGNIQRILVRHATLRGLHNKLFVALALEITAKSLGITVNMPMECGIVAVLQSKGKQGVHVHIEKLKLEESSTWLKLIFPFQKNKIRMLVQESIQEQADKYWLELQKMLAENLDQRELGKYVVLDVKAQDYDLKEIQIAEDHMKAVLHANVSPSLKIGNF